MDHTDTLRYIQGILALRKCGKTRPYQRGHIEVLRKRPFGNDDRQNCLGSTSLLDHTLSTQLFAPERDTTAWQITRREK